MAFKQVGGITDSMRVLVVDDCRRLADLIAEGLSDQGIAADVAYDGNAAAANWRVNRRVLASRFLWVT